MLINPTCDALYKQAELIAQLQGSFLLFQRTFYPLLTGREFILSNPMGRESHVITVSRALVKCFRLQTRKLIINIPPGHGKSTTLALWVAWGLAQYPDSNYLYISYSQTLAAEHTATIRQILLLPEYRELFNVQISSDSRAKDHFKTTKGGAVAAFGSAGAITGRNAGLPGLARFSGAVIIDDPHKPDEVHSDSMRGSVIANYQATIEQRPRSANVPIIFIGQRLHEEDLAAFLINGGDGHQWDRVILQTLNECENALYPEAFPLKDMQIKRATDKYNFAAQHQQNPLPAGGALFSTDDFVTLATEPEILHTFITADTAETDKTYNDATVFSFWGLYEIEELGQKTKSFALHWMDCVELRIEPKDLRDEFISFYSSCVLHKVKPSFAAIEKKSTGVTLISVLSEFRGLDIRKIERTAASGSKTNRFLEAQPFVAKRLISLPQYARHTKMCIEHMGKITANDTHRFDDIADTLVDAIRLGLIEKSIPRSATQSRTVAASIMHRQNKILDMYKQQGGH